MAEFCQKLPRPEYADLKRIDYANEWFEVYAVDASGMECQVLHTTDYINGFYGIVSPVPIKRIYFNESSLGDDIGISTIYFGYK